MGDVAMLVHTVRALRDSYPRLAITIATRKHFTAFFDGIDGVDFLTVDSGIRYKGICGMWRMAADARKRGVDTVADIHDVLRSKLLRLILKMRYGIPYSVIDKEKRLKRHATRRRNKDLSPLKHNVMRYCDTLANIGYPVVMPEVRRIERPIPKVFEGEKRGLWAGFSPFSKQVGKSYPIESSARLTDMLSERFERVFIFTGGGHEHRFALDMERTHGNVTAVYKRITLNEEIDLMSHLDVIVTMDSSAMHMASLVGTPTVSVWGQTHPATGFYGWGTKPSSCVQLDMPCRPCSTYGNRRCPSGDYKCMKDIPPSMILDRVMALTRQ